MRVMLIEDEPLTRETMALYLRSEGLEVQEAENMSDAARKLAREKPDVAVVDIMLGCVDLGEDLARELGGEGELSEEAARCLADTMLESDAFRDATAESFVNEGDPFQDPDLVAELLPAMLEGLSPEDLAELGS